MVGKIVCAAWSEIMYAHFLTHLEKFETQFFYDICHLLSLM
jgi:hypothetical protein